MFALMPTDEITIKAFYSVDKLAGTDEDTTLIYSPYIKSPWASYSKDALTLAVEYNMSENAGAYANTYGIDSEATGFLLMANYMIH